MSSFADALAQVRQQEHGAGSTPDFSAALAQVRQQGAPAAPASDPHPYLHAAENAVKGAANTISQGYVGALKGAGQTATGIGKLLLMGSGPSGIGQLAADEAVPNSGLHRIAQKLQPVGAPQKIGSAAENVAETYLLPGVGEADLPLRLGAQALMGAGLSKAHGGSALAGAAGGGGAELIGSGVRALAPTIARSALGLRRADFAYHARPDLAALDYTTGITPGAVAKSARGVVNRESGVLNRLADDASGAQIRSVPQPLALPPGPVEREAVPLHSAASVVERPSILQPAARPIVRDGSFTTSPATLNIPGATSGRLADFAGMRTPAENQAVAFLDRLGAEGENGVTYPQGKMPPEAVAHPLHEPLRTIRREEPAQGVWLRAPEGYVAPTQGGGGASFVATPKRTVSLRPGLNEVDKMAATHAAQNNETALRSLGRVRSQLTNRALTGEAIPEEVTPREALDLKRGVRTQFAKYRSEPQYDHSIASHAAKAASRALDPGLARALGPQYTAANDVIHSTLPIVERAESLGRGEGMLGRTLHRFAAHTGALTGAAIGAGYGGRREGLSGALKYGALGLLGPELLASPELGMAGARALYSPVTKRLLRGALVGGATAATKH